jgi:hypothetical protein
LRKEDKMRIKNFLARLVVLNYLSLCAPALASAQGVTVIVACVTGQNIEGELLVVGDSTVWVKTGPLIGSIPLVGEDSAMALKLYSGDIKAITVEGSSKVLLGAGLGVVLGAALGAGTAEYRWQGQGALFGGVTCGLVGTLIGALATRSAKTYIQDSHGGFAFLSEYARYGIRAPRSFERSH